MKMDRNTSPNFTLSDSLLVIKWLDTSDARFPTTMRPISLPVRDISKIENLSKTPSTIGVVIVVGVAAAVVGLGIWILEGLSPVTNVRRAIGIVGCLLYLSGFARGRDSA
jgi:hypothetical protein